MNKDNEILSRLMSIESTNEEIYKEIIRLQKDLKMKRFEELQTKMLVEDIYDYIKVSNCEKKNYLKKWKVKKKYDIVCAEIDALVRRRYFENNRK